MNAIRVHGEQVRSAVTLGLLAAWVPHDAEELATGPRWISENLPAPRERFPDVPGLAGVGRHGRRRVA